MKSIVLMFDSLNRHFLPPYGCDSTIAPNFQRLAKRSVTFENSCVCSMPCMPARRDLHTSRPGFLHRSWGPLEPFDNSIPEILKNNGVYTHLCSDHYHYWEEGSGNYHTKYSTWESHRGMEGDPWLGQVADPLWPEAICHNASRDRWTRQDRIHRDAMHTEDRMPTPRTFAAGMDFIRRNVNEDKWVLQLETFAPHEPFTTPRHYKDLYPHDYQGPLFDWPHYQRVKETPEEVAHCRFQYAADVTMCDRYLGDVMDLMDELDLWKDTMLIVWTDHGFLLGEHGHWAKARMPWYQELAHTPFFVWDPRSGRQGERRNALVQPALDIGPTLLDFFGLQPTKDMLGCNLRNTIASDQPVRDAAIFGIFGGQVNVTDGRYVYMRATADQAVPMHEYTLMPAHMTCSFSVEELKTAQLSEPQSWAKNLRLLKIPIPGHVPESSKKDHWLYDDTQQTTLWDTVADPLQTQPIQDTAIENRMIDHLVRLMRESDAPPEQFARLGLGLTDQAAASETRDAGGCKR